MEASLKLFFILLISSKVLLHSHYLSIKFGRSKKIGTYLHIYECLFLIASIEKKRMWKCSIEKLEWKDFVERVRNKPFIKILKNVEKSSLKKSVEKNLA